MLPFILKNIDALIMVGLGLAVLWGPLSRVEPEQAEKVGKARMVASGLVIIGLLLLLGNAFRG